MTPLYEVRTARGGTVYQGPSLLLAARQGRAAALTGERAHLLGPGLRERVYLPKLSTHRRWWYLCVCPLCSKHLMSPLPSVQVCRHCYESNIRSVFTSPFKYVKLFNVGSHCTSKSELEDLVKDLVSEVRNALRGGCEVKLKIGESRFGKWTIEVRGISGTNGLGLKIKTHRGWLLVDRPMSLRWRVDDP